MENLFSLTSTLITWYLEMEFHTQFKLLNILMSTYLRINDNRLPSLANNFININSRAYI